MKSLILAVFLMIGCLTSQAFASDESYLTKLTLRTGFGQLVNNGTSAGSSAVMGGFDLEYFYFLSPRLAVGFGYMAQFDMNSKRVPISGYEIIGRVYFYNEGTIVRTKEQWGHYESQSNFSMYAVSLYGKRQFYLGDDLQSSDPTKQLQGEYGVVNAGIGMDIRINHEFEYNIEFTDSLMSFASTDSRVQIADKMIWAGLNYAF